MDIKQALKNNSVEDFVSVCNQRYLTNLEIKRRIPSQWNVGEILTRIHQWRIFRKIATPLLNQKGESFWFGFTPKLGALQESIDRDGKDTQFEEIPAKVREKLREDNLLEEAFFSSQIEGAKTTRRRAEMMIREGARPKDRSEQETLNNYRAMEYILWNQEKPITEELIQKIHEVVTHQALDRGVPGQFRQPGDDTVVGDWLKTIYVPPPAEKVREYLQDLLDWMNHTYSLEERYIHPVVRASILHFYFVYLHPFPDGNGRTARALYYFCLNRFYNAVPYISISHVIGQKRSAYDKAILDVEQHGTDLTFFIHYSCEITRKAIDNLHWMVDRYALADRLDQILGERRIELSRRQLGLIKHMLRPEVFYVDLQWYQRKYKVVYETARRDLQSLENFGILEQSKIRKKFIYKLKEDFYGREKQDSDRNGQ